MKESCKTYKKFIRVQSYKDYKQSITSADFLAYLNTYEWLLAMDDLLLFTQARIQDSDFYEGEG